VKNNTFRTLLISTLLLLAACGQQPSLPPATSTPPASTPVASTPLPPPTSTPPVELSLGTLKDVPRNRTVVLGWPLSAPIGVTNPLNSIGYTHQEGNNLLWEGLAYYAVFADKDIPWLAESMDYTLPDFTQLTIKLNPAARWSDGQPVTATDVTYTFNTELTNDKLPYHSDFKQFVKDMSAPDDQTVVLNFKTPAPRFKFEVLTLKFDTGLPIVPAHFLEQQADVNTFAGGLEMPHSGPYNLVLWNIDQKVYDLRPDWWAVKAGLIPSPAVQRVVVLNIYQQAPDTFAERVVNDEFDSTGDLRSQVIGNVLKQNSKITSYTGDAPPYGYLDWWPNSLWVNTLLPPYSDVRVRRALSLAIDRDKLNEILYGGAPVATIYPFPLYPGLQRFVDSPDVKALEIKYAPGKFDLDESARLMTEAGFVKNADGLWEKDGETVNATLDGFEGIHGDIALLLVEMLKRGGFDASVYFGADAYDRMVAGSPGLYLFGHGASVRDPYATFELYHSRHSQPIGKPDDTYLSRYQNPAYDQIVDAMAVLSPDDPRFHDLAVQALEIYWRDVIDIPVIQWLHRIPYNQTYWTNWPTQANPAMGTNGAFWAQTGMLVITSLKPAQ
jgi:peptide/nickel transport system substrate-binding protein